MLKARLKPGDTGTYSEQWKVVFHHGSMLGLKGVKDVRIHDCFVRNHDDSIVVKTPAPDAPAEDIEVEGCTVWSDWGYALGVTYETRSPVRNVSFRGVKFCNIRLAGQPPVADLAGLSLKTNAFVSEVTCSPTPAEEHTYHTPGNPFVANKMACRMQNGRMADYP